MSDSEVLPNTTTQASPDRFFRYFPNSDNDVAWGAFVNTVGQTIVRPGEIYPRGGHPSTHQFTWSAGRKLAEYQLIYISSGQGRLDTSEGEYRVQGGDGFLLLPGVWHRYRPDPAAGWHEHWIGFEGDYVASLHRQGEFGMANRPVPMVDDHLVTHIYRSVMEIARLNRPMLRPLMSTATLHLLALLCSSEHWRLAADTQVDIMLQRAIGLLENEGNASTQLLELSEQFNVSYSWFRRLFKRRTGLSPHQYRLRLRLIHAKSMLANTSLTIKEIAFACGFESEGYFCRFFKKHNGETPSGLRQRIHLLTDTTHG